jgi:hypothetical protein
VRKVTGRNIILILLVATTIISCRPYLPQKEMRNSAGRIDPKYDRKVIVINFDRADERRIREEIAGLLTPRCTREFEIHGLRSPARLLQEVGVIIRPAEDLFDHSAQDLGLMGEEIRQAYWDEFRTGHAQAGTISPVLYGVRRTTDNTPRIFLYPTAFLGESFWFGRFSFREVMIHEFIHAGGQPPKPGPLVFLQHDLEGYKPYDAIINACK